MVYYDILKFEIMKLNINIWYLSYVEILIRFNRIIGTLKVIIADINRYRINIARKHGDYAVVNPKIMILMLL